MDRPHPRKREVYVDDEIETDKKVLEPKRVLESFSLNAEDKERIRQEIILEGCRWGLNVVEEAFLEPGEDVVVDEDLEPEQRATMYRLEDRGIVRPWTVGPITIHTPNGTRYWKYFAWVLMV